MKPGSSSQMDSRSLPTGFAFEIPDLVMATGWAEFHCLRMVVELDHHAGDDEYEEVLSLYLLDPMSLRWIMWRTQREIVVQPVIGRPTRFESMAEALDRTICIVDKIGDLTERPGIFPVPAYAADPTADLEVVRKPSRSAIKGLHFDSITRL